MTEEATPAPGYAVPAATAPEGTAEAAPEAAPEEAAQVPVPAAVQLRAVHVHVQQRPWAVAA